MKKSLEHGGELDFSSPIFFITHSNFPHTHYQAAPRSPRMHNTKTFTQNVMFMYTKYVEAQWSNGVSVLLDFQSEGLKVVLYCWWFSGIVLFPLPWNFTPWVLTAIMLGGNLWDGLASHPGRSSNIPCHFMLHKPELSAGLMGHWLINRLKNWQAKLNDYERKNAQMFILRWQCYSECLGM